MSAPLEVPAGAVCRWCGEFVSVHVAPTMSPRQTAGRWLVHEPGGRRYCLDGRHVAEVRPAGSAVTAMASCSQCGQLVAVSEFTDHWGACPGRGSSRAS